MRVNKRLGMRIAMVGFAVATIGFGLGWFDIAESVSGPLFGIGWLIVVLGWFINFQAVLGGIVRASGRGNKQPTDD